MNGTVIPHTPIAVDFWQIRRCSQIKLFFLSHLHGDHTKGLTSSWLQPIYCSPLTGQLLVNTLQVKSKLVRPLEVNTSHIIPLDDIGEETMAVTVIDANHCPGSVMFLFEGYFGTILYTGDFRYETLSGSVPLDLLKSKTVDIVYLDNTYCDPRCEFPTRSHSRQQIIDLITQHPDYNVVIALRNLGKEQLLVDLAVHFQTWIVVSKTQLSKLKILQLPNVFTTDPTKGFIHIEPFHQLSSVKVHSWTSDGKTLVILPTSLFTGLGLQPYSNCQDTHIVEYSDHSSYSELHAFIRTIAPKQVRPIVSGCTHGIFGVSLQNRADMSCFNDYLNKAPLMPITVPPSVERLKRSLPIHGNGAWKRKAKPFFVHVKRHQHSRGVNFDESPDQKSTSCESSDDHKPDIKHRLICASSSQTVTRCEQDDGKSTRSDAVIADVQSLSALTVTSDDVQVTCDEGDDCDDPKLAAVYVHKVTSSSSDPAFCETSLVKSSDKMTSSQPSAGSDVRKKSWPSAESGINMKPSYEFGNRELVSDESGIRKAPLYKTSLKEVTLFDLNSAILGVSRTKKTHSSDIDVKRTALCQYSIKDENAETFVCSDNTLVKPLGLSTSYTKAYTSPVLRNPKLGHIRRPFTNMQSTPAYPCSRSPRCCTRRHLPQTPTWQLERENIIIQQEVER